MIGVISDTAAILLGGTIGFLAKKNYPGKLERYHTKGSGTVLDLYRHFRYFGRR